MEINSPDQPINPPITPIQPVSKPVNNKRSFFPIILGILLLLALIGGGAYYLGTQNTRNTQTKNITTTPTPTPILISTPITMAPTNPNSPSSFNPPILSPSAAFYKAYYAKFPIPSPQPIPSGLEDQLFTIYNKALVDSGKQAAARFNFSIKNYYGDVVEGGIRYATEPNGEGAGAAWEMNKINGNWVVIFTAIQDIPMCKDIQSIMFELKAWQGLCADDSKNRVIDGKHPNESYNNY